MLVFLPVLPQRQGAAAKSVRACPRSGSRRRLGGEGCTCRRKLARNQKRSVDFCVRPILPECRRQSASVFLQAFHTHAPIFSEAKGVALPTLTPRWAALHQSCRADQRSWLQVSQRPLAEGRGAEMLICSSTSDRLVSALQAWVHFRSELYKSCSHPIHRPSSGILGQSLGI